MKNKLLCAFILYSCLGLNAQTIAYQPLHGNYTQYVYQSFRSDGGGGIVESFPKTVWSGDTIINSENYTRIFQNGQYYGGVRENVSTQQRFFMNANNIENEITISPFLTVGTVLTDSAIYLNAFRTYLDIYVDNNYDTLMIAEVDSILETNGSYSTTYHFESLLQPNTSFDFNTYRGLLAVNGFEFSDYQICYREDGEQTPQGEQTPWTFMCDLGMIENKLLNIGLNPNPSIDFVVLSGDDLSVVQELAIYDVHGKLVKQLTLSDIQSKISISELNNGVYLLTLNKNSKVLRFVKQ